MKSLMAFLMTFGSFAFVRAESTVEIPGDQLSCYVKQTQTSLVYDSQTQYYAATSGSFDVAVVPLIVNGVLMASADVSSEKYGLNVTTMMTPISSDLDATLIAIVTVGTETASIFCSKK